MIDQQVFRRILVATDFSAPADAAFQQAVWLARKLGASIDLVHVTTARRSSSADPKMDFYLDLLADQEQALKDFESKAAEEAMAKLQQMAARADNVTTKVYVGESYIEIARAVQQEGYDLVIAGTRGLSKWEQFLVGSTAKRLIRNCPASVWIVRPEHVGPPKVVLAATDFSEVSRKAVLQGISVAQQADAAIHLLHVIDSNDVPEDAISHVGPGRSLQHEIVQEAAKRMERFVDSLDIGRDRIQLHQSWGTPWQEIRQVAKNQAADLVVIGTVGRGGVRGLVLGNTAEKVLDSCDCSILAVKPDDYQSPLSL